jgi:hypothetical protein
MDRATKVKEIRLRRVAARRGLRLVRSRRRDPQAVEFGLYLLVSDSRRSPVTYAELRREGVTLDEIEKRLGGP